MNHIPRKRFGQNFLHDPAVLERIGKCIAPTLAQHVIEIGPGQGALTDVLLPNCGKLTAIEIDRDLAVFLHEKYKHQSNFELIEADALQWDILTLAKPTQGKFRLVGNLPYNISTPLLFHLFEHANQIQDMHFLLQKEVVDRLVAPPGSKTYGRLSVMAQYEADLEQVLFVGPGAFTPPPKVDSALVRIVPKTPSIAVQNKKIFFDVVRDAFGQRRKTLRNALKNLVSESDWIALGIDAVQRAECLSVEDFVRISNQVSPK